MYCRASSPPNFRNEINLIRMRLNGKYEPSGLWCFVIASLLSLLTSKIDSIEVPVEQLFVILLGLRPLHPWKRIFLFFAMCKANKLKEQEWIKRKKLQRNGVAAAVAAIIIAMSIAIYRESCAQRYNFYLIMKLPHPHHFDFWRFLPSWPKPKAQISFLFLAMQSTLISSSSDTKERQKYIWLFLFLPFFNIVNLRILYEAWIRHENICIGGSTGAYMYKRESKRKCVANRKDDGKNLFHKIQNVNNNNQNEAVCDSREIKCTAEPTKIRSHHGVPCV